MTVLDAVNEQVARLTAGCVDVVRLEALRARIQESVETRRPLVVKVGFDPTAPDLHLGHTVLIRKMRQFQDFGHIVVFVVGDFTAMIGDPTGRSRTRPPLTREEIEANAATYTEQAFKLLDRGRTRLEYNSRWLLPLGSDGVVKLTAKYTVAQMLERRDFKQRLESGQSIALHEFIYPLAQAYDSVALQADVELGGTDQLFNLNVGRDIMPAYGLRPQIVMTTPLLEGLDGVEKMSKSAGNYVGITEPPNEMFGKLMSISDELMWRYYRLLTSLSESQVGELRARVERGDVHPKQAKMDLARRIVTDLHSAEAAARAAEEFERVHARGELPEEIPDVPVTFGSEPEKALARIMADAGLAGSASDAGRKIGQGGVRLGGSKVSDPRLRLSRAELPVLLRVGRRTVRLVVSSGEKS
ncbi:MAG TPA: tyrosine--tRNA ligase [Vicinamibacterales bacterium]|nr:tyrosine--tRNA ligase [Vicinamibacterales bacterium]